MPQKGQPHPGQAGEPPHDMVRDGAVGQRRNKLADKSKGFGAIGRKQSCGDRPPLALTNFSVTVPLEPATQNALTVVFRVKNLANFVKEQGRFISIDAAINC